MDIPNKIVIIKTYNYFEEILNQYKKLYELTPCEFYKERIKFNKNLRDYYANLLAI